MWQVIKEWSDSLLSLYVIIVVLFCYEIIQVKVFY